MKVLARRANGIFVFAPVFMVLCFVLWMFCAQKSYDSSEWYVFDDLYVRLLLISIILFPVTLWYFIQRLFVPRVIIECDDFGLYIYRRRKETVILRFEYLESLYAEADMENTVVYIGRRSLFSGDRRRIEIGGMLEKFIKTGTLEIRTEEGVIKLKGVHNVKKVKTDIDRLIRKNRGTREAKSIEHLQYADRSAVEEYLKDRNYL